MLFASAPREAPLAPANAPFCSRAIAAQLSPPSATSRSHSTMGVACADAADHDTFLHGIHNTEKFLGMLDGGLIAVLLFIGFFISSGDGCKGACAYIGTVLLWAMAGGLVFVGYTEWPTPRDVYNISYWHEGAPTTYEIITNGEECIIEGNLVLASPLLAALASSTVIFGLVLCCCGFVTCKGGKDKPGNMH